MHATKATNAAYPPKLLLADEIMKKDRIIIIIFNLNFNTFFMVSETQYDFPDWEFFDLIKSGNTAQNKDTRKAVKGIIIPSPIVKNNIIKIKIYKSAHPQCNNPHISPSFQLVSFLDSSL